MSTTVRPASPQNDQFGNFASSDPVRFREMFGRVRYTHPEETIEGCIWYIATVGLDSVGWNMAFWLTHDCRYLTSIFSAENLIEEVAVKALIALREVDQQFASNFIKTASNLKEPVQIMRAMSYLPKLGDFSVFVSWLRSLSHHADERVRSQSVKLFCTLRPNKGLIERQLQSKDPRVRGNAVEVLWNAHTADATSIFKQALADPHHRVVTNALVGLFLQHDPSAFEQLLNQAVRPEPLFRAATAWAFGEIKSVSAIPVLELFLRDPSVMVRKRATKSLDILRKLQPAPRPPEPANPAPPAMAAPALPAAAEPAEVHGYVPGFFSFR